MPFEGQISVRYHDQVALSQDLLEKSTLRIQARAKLEGGEYVDLEEIRIPQKAEGFSQFQDIQRLSHYNQQYGSRAFSDVNDRNQINPAVFFTDDAEENTRRIM